MVARAMLPVGFMPAMDATGAQLKLCSALFSPLQDSQLQDTQTPADTQHSDLTCPFAQAGGAAPLTTLPPLVIAFTGSNEIFAPAAQLGISYGPPRIDRVRGPPTLI